MPRPTLEQRQEKFIRNASRMYNNEYDYSLVKYVKAIQRVTIICKCGVQFTQSPANHLTSCTGCKTCSGISRGKKLKHSTPQFIEDSIKVHGNKYDYSLVNYTKWNIKVKIICPYHGIFEQEANSHKQGIGCPTCGRYKTSRMGGMSNITELDNEIVTLYLVKFKGVNNNYNFIKVGLTSREPFMKRFQYKEYYDYEIETLSSYSLPAKKAIELERDCLSNFINCRFLLRKSDNFKGSSELFKCKHAEEILEYLETQVKALCIDSDAS